MCIELISLISDNYWKLIENRRKIRFTVHRAYFLAVGVECFFLNVTNLSSKKEIEITHVYFQNEDGNQIPVIQPDRPLPKRLRPDETWETWIRVELLPVNLLPDPFKKARLRLSTGKTFRSRYNKNVPQTGEVPGGMVTRI
jgi:hypothetical protein